MPIMDAVKSVLSGVATPFEHPVQTASAIGNEAQKLGNDLVNNAGRPAPTYSVDPTTGQMQTQQGPATKGNFFKSMLTGALLGLAAGAGADNPAAAFGAGAGGVIRNNQQQDQLTRQQATQNFQSQLTAQQNQREVAAASDAHKLAQLRGVAANLDIAGRQEAMTQSGLLFPLQLKDAADKLAKDYSADGYSSVGDPIASDADMVAFQAQHPDYANSFAKHLFHLVPQFEATGDGKVKPAGYSVMVRAPGYTDPNAPNARPYTMPEVGADGKILWHTVPAGASTEMEAQAHRSMAFANVLKQMEAQASTSHENAAAARERALTQSILAGESGGNGRPVGTARSGPGQDVGTDLQMMKTLSTIAGGMDTGNAQLANQLLGQMLRRWSGAATVTVKFADGSTAALPPQLAAQAVQQGKGTIVNAGAAPQAAPAAQPSAATSQKPAATSALRQDAGNAAQKVRDFEKWPWEKLGKVAGAVFGPALRGYGQAAKAAAPGVEGGASLLNPLDIASSEEGAQHRQQVKKWLDAVSSYLNVPTADVGASVEALRK